MFIRYNLFGIIWGVIILILTLSPGVYMPETPDWKFLRFDIFAHFFVFGVFVLLLALGFIKQDTYQSLKQYPVLIAIIIGIVYGILIEIVQGWIPGRQFDYFDMVANAIGCFTGSGIFYIMRKYNIS